ncbi:hypothetical protein [Motilimonas pumila]|uniref:Uncharacterized protein n=1 Tax=Motilimonas pumila TaxID=2303987 RepID=A0A418YI02_9GAMM|nr:hypothetical protein [Motilimonas pumila]RJG49967.1 hypothetical protein D1Z90_04800 [Motilimonas pumila]
MDFLPRVHAHADALLSRRQYQEHLATQDPQIISHLEGLPDTPEYFSLHALQLLKETDVIKPTMR